MLAVVLCCVVLSATVDVSESRYTPHNFHLLSVRKTIATWEEADEICKNEGATLASPIDLELFKYMKNVISINNHSTAFFIGIKASHSSGQTMEFVSREGIPVHEMPNEVLNTIEQLDLMDGDCLCMTQFNIHVLPCLSRLPYFCYKNVTKHLVEGVTSSPTIAQSYFPIESSTLTIKDSTTESITDSTAESTISSESIVSSPTTSNSSTVYDEIYFSNSSYLGYTKYYAPTGSCYKYHRTSNGWDEAREVCRSEGADLAVINDEKEAKVVANVTEQQYHAWIGLRDRDQSGDWRSVQGHRVNEIYNTWRPGVTHGFECAVITTTGFLDDYNCFHTFGFICERKVNCKLM